MLALPYACCSALWLCSNVHALGAVLVASLAVRHELRWPAAGNHPVSVGHMLCVPDALLTLVHAFVLIGTLRCDVL